MIIEFSNVIQPKNHSAIGVAIVVTACAFFFIPTTLIILGYYSTQPTGSLISPLPQGVLSENQPTPEPTTTAEPTVVPTVAPENKAIVAADNSATAAASAKVAPEAGSNIIDKVATVSAGLTETTVKDLEVNDNTQVYLSPRPEDKAVYSVRSKMKGEFVISVSNTSPTDRHIDYHLVNP